MTVSTQTDVIPDGRTGSATSGATSASVLSSLVDDLNNEDDSKQVTIIELMPMDMSFEKTCLYHIIAEYVPSWNGKAADSTSVKYHITNNNLHDAIAKNHDRSLEGITPDKVKKIRENAPPYVVTTELPSRSGSGAMDLRSILSPSEIKLKEAYIYEAGNGVKITLYEPSSPMDAEYTVPSVDNETLHQVYDSDSLSFLFEVIGMSWRRESLDQGHLKIFHDLRRLHKEKDSQAVTAITCVTVNRLQIEQHIFLVGALLYGKGKTEHKPPHGLRVSLVPILNNSIRGLIDQKWKTDHRIPLVSCSKSAVASNSINEADLMLPSPPDSPFELLWTRNGRYNYLKVKPTWKSLRDVDCWFRIADEYGDCPEEIKQLRDPIPDKLLSAETYMNSLSCEDVTNHRDCDTVMINVQTTKTKLRQKKTVDQSDRRKKTNQLRLIEGVQSNVMIVVAVGSEDSIHIPGNFWFHEPLNSWRSKTVFLSCRALSKAILLRWSEQPGTESTLIAPHVVFSYKPDSELLQITDGIIRAREGELEFMCHVTKEVTPKSNILYQALSQNQAFAEACRGVDNIENCLDWFRKRFFNEQDIPTSYKFATAKFKHCSLERPNQLGVLGALVLLFQNAAHIKFTTEEALAKEVSNNLITDCFHKAKVDAIANANAVAAVKGAGKEADKEASKQAGMQTGKGCANQGSEDWESYHKE